jgi:hypothetical protein
MRVLASAPDLDADADADAVARLLADARATHALTVVDCGTLRGPVDRLVLAAATHVAWVLPATLSGVVRASRVLSLFGTEGARRELVVARSDAGGRKAPSDELAALATRRNAPLVLMPDVPDLAERSPYEARATAAVTLQAIRMEVMR